ncbi:MAG TPA: glycosyltransferase [Solirubrobacteraceae bacterium]
MRILIFHGYLLAGTGSNVYNARLAEALVGLGHDVHLLSQDRHPEQHAFVDAVGDWDDGALRVRELRAAGRHGGRCTVYRPDIGGLLPVYVADRYEGIEARTFARCSDVELADYVAANVRAVEQLVALAEPELALANHLVMAPLILARALPARIPYAVKIHGSALEYTVKAQPERFLPPAREGLAGARGILVGSRHTGTSLWQALADPSLAERTRLGPPGVDVRRFAPREEHAAAAGVRALAARLRAEGGERRRTRPHEDGERRRTPPQDEPRGGTTPALSVFSREPALAAAALESLALDGGAADDLPVAFVGKLIVSKGIDLLLAAWPLVLASEPRARLVVVGFGAYRGALERLRDALLAGDLAEVRGIALAGRALEQGGEAPRPLRHLLAFLDGLGGEAAADYLRAARTLGERVLFTGRLEHEELAELLPACRALVVPSTFPEAFGMVAAEAGACGVLPISAAHSGLAEVSRELARAVPATVVSSLSFPVDDDVVPALAARVVEWLALDPGTRAQTRAGLVATVREQWSWDRVGAGVIAAAQGQLEGLREP